MCLMLSMSLSDAVYKDAFLPVPCLLIYTKYTSYHGVKRIPTLS